MGCAGSKEMYAPDSGTEAEFKASFEEKRLLGQGEFGVVKLVTKKGTVHPDPYAVKILQKGFVFRDNVLYPPMKPDKLMLEIDVLRALGGREFNLVLDSIYESSSKIYLVTEVCEGGEMLEYISKTMSDGLRTEDVSRIAHQLLSAVNHCDAHGIIHRDIKPENIMFKSNAKTADLRLIDFGCAARDSERGAEHETMAGTAFYISPEVFQKCYTFKTDVFSAGVVLYVLVGGYPADQLQAAFNLLHKSKRDLKTLPGMPDGMPDTYYEMLNKLLTYNYKKRPTAADLLKDEFALFHQAKGKNMSRTKSVLLEGTGEKAATAFGFIQFQRSLTTLLATMLDRGDLLSLLSFIESKVSADAGLNSDLGVMEVKEIKSILETMGKLDCVSAIKKQKNAQMYEAYSYEYTHLKPFVEKHEGGGTPGRQDPASQMASSMRFTTKTDRKSDLGGSFRADRSPLSMSERVKSVRKMSRAQSVHVKGF